MADDQTDRVFKALADPGRHLLLDRLRQDNGQTLGQLCEYLEMARQSVSQHLALLESANLISTVRRGRLKLHYLNPLPLQAIAHRWTEEFERPRLHALRAVKHQAEEAEMTAANGKPSFVYVTYIHSRPEKVWEALTDADLTAAYWGHSNVSDWRPGSRWEHRRTDGSGIADVVGEVIEASPPHRLVITFAGPDASGPPSLVRFDRRRRDEALVPGARFVGRPDCWRCVPRPAPLTVNRRGGSTNCMSESARGFAARILHWLNPMSPRT